MRSGSSTARARAGCSRRHGRIWVEVGTKQERRQPGQHAGEQKGQRDLVVQVVKKVRAPFYSANKPCRACKLASEGRRIAQLARPISSFSAMMTLSSTVPGHWRQCREPYCAQFAALSLAETRIALSSATLASNPHMPGLESSISYSDCRTTVTLKLRRPCRFGSRDSSPLAARQRPRTTRK